MAARLPRTVGLLGGSFNPAHDGHVHISRLAIKRLGLDQVWWLVSPQNPLKAKDDMAPLAERLAGARSLVEGEAGIVATALEADLGTRYTADTLVALQTAFPDVKFVWLIGADNLAQMHRWRDWQAIFATVPIAVFPRAPYSLGALGSRAARLFKGARVPETQARRLAALSPPAWVYLTAPLHGESATRIRGQAKQDQAKQDRARQDASGNGH